MVHALIVGPKMKNRRVRYAVWIGLVAGIPLFIAPLVAGYFQIGDRDGPFFYPEALHSQLYIIGHEAATDTKPRMSLTWVLYDRPLFWGLLRRPKSEAERKSYIRRIAEREGPDSPFIKWLLEEQQRIKTGQQDAPSNGG